MDWLWIGIPAGGLAAGIFAVALLRASRLLRRVEGETRALAELGAVESPSGTPVFPDDDSIWELAGSLEDPALREDAPGCASAARRRTRAGGRMTRPRAGLRLRRGGG